MIFEVPQSIQAWIARIFWQFIMVQNTQTSLLASEQRWLHAQQSMAKLKAAVSLSILPMPAFSPFAYLSNSSRPLSNWASTSLYLGNLWKERISRIFSNSPLAAPSFHPSFKSLKNVSIVPLFTVFTIFANAQAFSRAVLGERRPGLAWYKRFAQAAAFQ